MQYKEIIIIYYNGDSMKRVYKNNIFGIIFVSVLGALCHFLYRWSGNSVIVGLFCPINESIWEHIKLLFFPYLLWGIIGYFCLRDVKALLLSKLCGVLEGMVFIPIFYYSYTGIFGKSIEILNILSFFISVIIAFVTEYLLIKSGILEKKSNAVAIMVFIAIALLFGLFTFAPPFIPLFRDPITFTYGI